MREYLQHVCNHDLIVISKGIYLGGKDHQGRTYEVGSNDCRLTAVYVCVCVCVCVQLNLAVHLKLTQHSKSATS